jgi:hypothetical protein
MMLVGFAGPVPLASAAIVRAFVTGETQALDLAEQEGIHVAVMVDEMVDEHRRRDLARAQARGAQRISPQFGPRALTPRLKLNKLR